MRLLLIVLFFCSTWNAAYGQGPGLNWSSPISVADGAVYGNSWTRIALTDNNVPVIMWGNTSNSRIYVSRLSGSTFANPVNVVPSGMEAFVADWAGPDIGAWKDSVFVTFKSIPTIPGKVYVVRSVDGGLTFSDTIRVEDIQSDVSRFPALDVTTGGNPVVTFMRFDSTLGNAKWEVARSWDGGQTFGAAVGGSNAAPGDVCDCCPTDIHVAGDIQLLPFRNNDNNIRDTWLAISENSGASYDTIVRVDNSNWNIMACPSQGPDATLAGDSIATVWATGNFGPNQVWVTVADRNTHAVAYSRRLETIASGSQQLPRIVAKGDTLGAMWEDSRNGNLDCYFAFSVNGPAGLLSGGQNAVASPSGTQENPDVAFADGVFHIVYRDVANNEVVYRTATIDASTNIQVENVLDDMKIFPNPANDQVHVQLPKGAGMPVTLSVMDLNGRELMRTNASGRMITLSVDDLAPGLYLIEVKGGNQCARQKLLVH